MSILRFECGNAYKWAPLKQPSKFEVDEAREGKLS